MTSIRQTFILTGLFAWCMCLSAFDFSITAEPSASAYNIGETVTFTIMDAQEEARFFWKPGEQPEQEGNSFSMTFTEPGAIPLSVYGIADDGERSETHFRLLLVNTVYEIPDFNAEITAPEEERLVVASGTELTFSARADCCAEAWIWQVADTQLIWDQPSFTWTPGEELEGFTFPVTMNAISEVGSAMRQARVRWIHVYGDQPPPRGEIVEPEDFDGNTYTMQMDDTVRFTVASAGSGALFHYWVVTSPDGQDTLVEADSLLFDPTSPGTWVLTAASSDEQEIADPFPPQITVRVKQGNAPPAGWIETPSMTIERDYPVELEAGGWDPDGDPLSFCWTLNGETAGEGEELSLELSEPGIYRVAVIAEDTEGLADETPFERWIFVNEPYDDRTTAEPQVAITDPENGSVFMVGETITMNATGEDPEGGDLTYYWDFGDGTLAEGVQQTHRYTTTWLAYNEPERAYDISLFARDTDGLTSHDDSIGIGIYDGTPPPQGIILSPAFTADDEGPPEFGLDVDQISFDDPQLELHPGEVVELVGGVVGVDDLTGYSAWWDFDFGDFEVRIHGFAPDVPNEVFEHVGEFIVRFVVIDPNGLVDPVPAELDIWIREDDTPPEAVEIVAPGSDIAIFITDGIDLVAEAEDDSDQELTFEWTITRIEGQAGDCTTGTDVRCLSGEYFDYLTFETPGLYRVSVTASDDMGNVTSDVIPRYVNVLPDFADLTAFSEPPEVKGVLPGEPLVVIPIKSRLTFQATAEDEEGQDITTYFWDFGNGNTEFGASPGAEQYNKAGYHVVRAYARDASGIWSIYPYYWFVYAYGGDNIPPSSTITEPMIDDQEDDDLLRHLVVVEQGTRINFVAQGSDADGDVPLKPHWLLDEEEQIEFEDSYTASFTFDEPGEHHVAFGVQDARGTFDPFGDFRIVKVVDPNEKPAAYIIEPSGDITVEPGEPVYFFGFAEDPNDLEASYVWDFGPATVTGDLTEEFVGPVVFETASETPYTVTLTATSDYTGKQDVASIQVRVVSYQDSDFEPNDNPGEARSLQQGSYSSLSLDSDAGDDADYFTFTVTEDGKDICLELASTGDANGLDLKLYRQVNDELSFIEAGTLPVGATSVTLENMPAGTYFIEVRLSQAAAKAGRAGLSYSLSIGTLQPALFLPLLVEDGTLSSSIGIINTASTSADIVITGLDERGQPKASKSMTLAGNARLFTTSSTLFGKTRGKVNAQDIHQVKVQSTTRLVGYTNTETLDKTQLMSMCAVKSLSENLLVPHIAAKTEQWYTRAVVVNADEKQRALNFSAKNGMTGISNGLAANHQLDFRFVEVFNQDLPGWGEIQSVDRKPTLAGFEIFGRVDGKKEAAGLELIDIRRVNPNFVRERGNLYFTHVAKNTAEFWTGISLINLDTVDATYDIIGYNDAGGIAGELRGRILEPGGKLLTTTQDLFTNATELSWIKIETDNKMAGFELFGDWNGKRLAGFQTSNSATDTLYFPHLQVEAGKQWTGIALLNIDSQEVVLTLEAFNDQGSLLKQENKTLAGRTKLLAVAEQVFTDGMPAGTTYIRVSAQRKVIVGFELFGSMESATVLGEQFAGLPALRE